MVFVVARLGCLREGQTIGYPDININLFILSFRHLNSLPYLITPVKALFSAKNTDIFLFLHENICCGYSLEVSR